MIFLFVFNFCSAFGTVQLVMHQKMGEIALKAVCVESEKLWILRVPLFLTNENIKDNNLMILFLFRLSAY